MYESDIADTSTKQLHFVGLIESESSHLIVIGSAWTIRIVYKCPLLFSNCYHNNM